MKKLLIILALSASTAQYAGGFKRFFQAVPGERMTSVADLPGDGLLVTGEKTDGSGTFSRVLFPATEGAWRIPAGASVAYADSRCGIVLSNGNKLFHRSFGKKGILRRLPQTGPVKAARCNGDGLLSLTLESGRLLQLTAEGIEVATSDMIASGTSAVHQTETAAADGKGAAGASVFELAANGAAFQLRTGTASRRVVEAQAGQSIVEWDGDARLGWVIISARRELPLLPPRREIRVYDANGGALLAKTTLSKDAPEKMLAISYKPQDDLATGVIVFTGANLEWWSPEAVNLERWGEITLDLEKAIPAN